MALFAGQFFTLPGGLPTAWGVFRSDDSGGYWTGIDDAAHQWGLILQVSGDSRIYDRIYVGTARSTPTQSPLGRDFWNERVRV